MSTPSSSPSAPLIDWRTNPSTEAKSSLTNMVIVVILALVTIALIAGAVLMGWFLLIFAALTGLATAVWASLVYNSYAASKLTGDDLITIVVSEEGLTTQGGLTTAWSEIGAVDIVTEQIQHTGGRHLENRAAAAATNAALKKATGYDGYVTRLKITITEQAYAAVKQRADTKIKRLVLFGPMLGDPAKIDIGLGKVRAAQLADLEEALRRAAAPHGVVVDHAGPTRPD